MIFTETEPEVAAAPATPPPSPEEMSSLLSDFWNTKAQVEQSPEFNGAEPDAQTESLHKLMSTGNDVLGWIQPHVDPQTFENAQKNMQSAFDKSFEVINARRYAPEPPGFAATAARHLATGLLPAAVAPLGFLAGAAVGAETGPGAIVTGLIGAGVTSGLMKKAQNTLMGPEAFASNEAALAAGEKAHPTAAMLGGLAPLLLSGVNTAGTKVMGAGEQLLGRSLTPVGKAAMLAGAKKAPLAERFAHSLYGGLQISTVRQAENVASGGDVSFHEVVKGTLAFGIPGLFPVAKNILWTVAGRAITDATTMEFINDFYDAVQHGHPFDFKGFRDRTAGAIPDYLIMNAIMALTHHVVAKTSEASAHADPLRQQADNAAQRAKDYAAWGMAESAKAEKEAEALLRATAEKLAADKLAELAAKDEAEATEIKGGKVTPADKRDKEVEAEQKAKTVGAPAFVSRQMEQQLADLGYSKDERSAMKPEEAMAIINAGVSKTPAEPAASAKHANIFSLKPNGDGHYMLTVRDKVGKRIGQAGFTVIERHSERLLSIDDITVAEPHRGRGIGTLMYEHALTNLPEGIDGLFSDADWLKNKEQVPRIHQKLAEQFDVVRTTDGTIFKPRKPTAEPAASAPAKAEAGATETKPKKEGSEPKNEKEARTQAGPEAEAAPVLAALPAAARIRDDLPEAKPILDKIDALTAEADRRHAAMAEGQTKALTHPTDLLTYEEKSQLAELQGQLRPKSQQEARADVAVKRKAAPQAAAEAKPPKTRIEDQSGMVWNEREDGWYVQPKGGPESKITDARTIDFLNDKKANPSPAYEVTKSSAPAAPGTPEGGKAAQVQGVAARSVPIVSLNLSKDVPQFKAGANAQGIVEPLGGKFDNIGTGPIQVWERLDGALEVISGRHRLDLARRSGEKTILAQVHREADGFDKLKAARLDAELNIRDGQGSIADYANFFRNSQTNEADAEAGGLLARAKGKAGFRIGTQASEDVYAAHQSGRISDEAAQAIAEAAPHDAGAQQIGLKAVLERKSAEYAGNLIKAARSMANQRKAEGQQGDLFGFDDSAMRQMEQQAKAASLIQSELRKNKAAINGAAKDPVRAKAQGVDVQDPAQVAKQVAAINAELARWENWPTHPDLVERTRQGEAKPVEHSEFPQPGYTAEAPKLRPGEKATGELFQGEDQPFNLAGEKGTDFERIQAEKDASAKREAEARAKADKEQQNLFEPPKPEEPAAGEEFGGKNKIISNDRAEELRARLKKKLGQNLTVGVDPTIFSDAVQLGAYYIEGGYHRFADWSTKMLADFGEAIRNHLKSIYETARITIQSPGGESRSGQPPGLQPGLKPPTERIVTARAEFTHRADESVIPAELLPHLDEHQRQGAAAAITSLENRGGFLLADGTGAGKTRQALAVAHYHAKAGRPVIIVTKAETIKPDWKKNTFGGSYGYDSGQMGVKVNLARDGSVKPGEIGITTYENLANVDRHTTPGTVLIFDESHALKNDSQRAKYGLRAIAKAKSVMFMSATPGDKPEHIAYLARMGIMEGKTVQQQLRDLGMELVTVKKRDKDGKTYDVTFWAPDQKITDTERNRRFSALFNRMTGIGAMLKREISMDGVHVQVLRLSLPPEAHELQKDILEFFDANHIDDLQGLKKATVLGHQRRQQEPYKIPSTIMLAQRELAAGRQVVVFVSRVNESEVGKWVTMVGLGGERERVRETLMRSDGTAKSMREAFEDAGIHDIAEIHGNADQNSLEAMADFQAGHKRVVIATIESGGTGINLDDILGNRPRSMIIVTAPFDAVGNVQAAGRIWRLKTLSKANLFYLFGDTDVDQWNADIIGSKMATLGAVVEGQVRRLDVSDPDQVTTDQYHEGRIEPIPAGEASKLPKLDWNPFKTKAGADKFVAPATPEFWKWWKANGEKNNAEGLRVSKWQDNWQVWSDRPIGESKFSLMENPPLPGQATGSPPVVRTSEQIPWTPEERKAGSRTLHQYTPRASGEPAPPNPPSTTHYPSGREIGTLQTLANPSKTVGALKPGDVVNYEGVRRVKAIRESDTKDKAWLDFDDGNSVNIARDVRLPAFGDSGSLSDQTAQRVLRENEGAAAASQAGAVSDKTGKVGEPPGAKPEARMSLTAEAPARGTAPREVRAAADRFARNFAGAPQIVVVEDGEQLPQGVKDDAARNGVSDLNRIEGVLHNGTVYLNSKALKSPQRAAEVLLHEIGSHIGVDSLLEGIKPGSLKHLDAVLKQAFPREYAAAAKSYAPGKVVSETLAKIMERTDPLSDVERTWWNRVIDYIRTTLAKVGLKSWTAGDVEALLRRGLAKARAGSVPESRGAVQLGNAVLTPPQEAPEMSLTAHHGTPHEVDRFSTEKIGTGEGAQVYGWGLYMADRKETAESYQKALPSFEVNGRKVFPPHWQDIGPQTTAEQYAAKAMFSTRGDRARTLREDRDSFPDPIKAEAAAKLIESGQVKQATGNLYTVHLDVEPDDLLDWDKPLSEQNEKVQKAIRGHELAGIIAGDPTGSELYRTLASRYDEKGTSNELSKIGLGGIRYLDQGSRSKPSIFFSERDNHWGFTDSKGEERTFATKEEAEQAADKAVTRNYVIFDDSKIRITHKNGAEITPSEATTNLGEKSEARFSLADTESEQAVRDEIPKPVAGLAKFFKPAVQTIVGARESKPVRDLMAMDAVDEGTQHAGVKNYVPIHVSAILHETFGDRITDIPFVEKIGETLRDDNIVGGYEDLKAELADLQGASEPDEGAIASLEERLAEIESAHDIPALKASLQASQSDPELGAAIGRYANAANPEMDELFNELQGIDPATPRDTRGWLYGARVNLLPKFREAMMADFIDPDKPMPEVHAGSYRNPDVKRDRFNRKAKYTGDYSGSLENMLLNSFGSRLNETTKLRLYKKLIAGGHGVLLDPGEQKPELINGEKAAILPIKMPQTVNGKTAQVERRLAVQESKVATLRNILATDMRPKASPILQMLTKLQVFGIADATTHSKNQLSVVASALALDRGLKAALVRVPILGSIISGAEIYKVGREVNAGGIEVIRELDVLAKNGMLRSRAKAVEGWQKYLPNNFMAKFLHDNDTAARLIASRTYDKLVKSPSFKAVDSLEGKRAFVMQIGEYNRRMMQDWEARLRDIGLSPFIVAGRTFNRFSRKLVFGTPGFQSTDTASGLKARAAMLAAPIATVMASVVANMLLTGTMGGREGTPFGAIDLGPANDDENGKRKFLDLLQLTGIRRGLRGIGADALLSGKGLGDAMQDIVTTAFHPISGPGAGAVAETFTGERIDLRQGWESKSEPRHYDDKLQQKLENLRSALHHLNALGYSLAEPIVGAGLKAAGMTMPESKGYGSDVGSALLKSPASAAGYRETNSPAMQLAREINKGNIPSMSLDEAASARAMERHDAIAEVRQGNNAPLRELARAHVIRRQDIPSIIRRAKMPPIVSATYNFTAEALEKVMAVASEEEKKLLGPLLRKKQRRRQLAMR